MVPAAATSPAQQGTHAMMLTETELDRVSGGRVFHGGEAGMNMIRVQTLVSEYSMNSQLASRFLHALGDANDSVISKIGH